MEQATMDTVLSIVQKEAWTTEDHDCLLEELYATTDAASKFRGMLGEMETQNPDAKGNAALKIGIARYMLCKFPEALQAFAAAPEGKERHYYAGQCHRNRNNYAAAAEEFTLAKGCGWDATEIAALLIEGTALSGDCGQAAKALDKISAVVSQTATGFYLKGLIAELGGDGEGACEAYEQARELQESHPQATFRLAYYLDLHGEEEEAVELYEECLSHIPIRANALLNLAILCEDAGKYDQAVGYLRRLLAANPQHQRAKLFLKDAEAATDMYYDEDQVRRTAKRDAILDIPVTDFELSVRARNCLKKMNIRTLGDLVRTSEPELLGYKNFGETSLKEIKEMLTAKNLRLGQALEDTTDYSAGGGLVDLQVVKPAAIDDGTGTPIMQIELSVRSRRVLEQLGILKLEELANMSEVELMSQKNFGQTSLNEIRERLIEHGMNFRGAE